MLDPGSSWPPPDPDRFAVFKSLNGQSSSAYSSSSRTTNHGAPGGSVATRRGRTDIISKDSLRAVTAGPLLRNADHESPSDFGVDDSGNYNSEDPDDEDDYDHYAE